MNNRFNEVSLRKRSKNVWSLNSISKELTRVDGAFFGCKTYAPFHNGAFQYEGIEPRINRSSPIMAYNNSGGDFWKGIDGTGGSGIFALHKYDNTIWMQGGNGNGELGQGDTIYRNFLVEVPGVWSSFSSTDNYTGAINSGENLYLWGANSYGQLGQGDTVPRSSPIQVPGKWKRILCTSNTTLALDVNNKLFAWGYNGHGQLANLSTNNRSLPNQIPGTWSEVFDAGANHVCAVNSDRELYVWGYNAHGELGNGHTTPVSSPVPGIGGAWSQISCSDSHTLFFQKGGGENQSRIWATGNNDSGQLGLHDTRRRSRPYLIQGRRSSPNMVPADTGFFTDSTILLDTGGEFNATNAVQGGHYRGGINGFQNWFSVHAHNGLSFFTDHGGGLWWTGTNSHGMTPYTDYGATAFQQAVYANSSSPIFISSSWQTNFDNPSQSQIRRMSASFLGLRDRFNKDELHFAGDM